MKEKISKDEKFFHDNLEKRCTFVSAIITAVIVILLIILLGVTKVFGEEFSSMTIGRKFFQHLLAIIALSGLGLFAWWIECKKRARIKKNANKDQEKLRRLPLLRGAK
jgi:protein-S-isoprenylcysteine O-methyltransferase Ste14